MDDDQTVKSVDKVELPESITIAKLKKYYEETEMEYANVLKKMTLLRAADRNDLWRASGIKFPAYQILPYTNHVSYIKSNLVANLYCVGRQGEFTPTSEADKQLFHDINLAMDHLWEAGDIAFKQMKAGSDAALYNLGITQVSWDTSKSGKLGSPFKSGEPILTTISPLKWRRDPQAAQWEDSRFVYYWSEMHKDIIEANELYKDALGKHNSMVASPLSTDTATRNDRASGGATQTDQHKIVYFWVKDGDDMYEVHTLDLAQVLHVVKLKPAVYPFALLFCNDPGEDLIGISEPAKIFPNSLAYNMNHSIILTAEFKNQRPPRFVSNMAQMNLASFSKHGNDTDYTFVVQGPADRAVHYQQFPVPSPQALSVGQTLGYDIKNMSGVSDKYTGSNMGSVTTTGGMEQLIDQASAIDAPKILNYNYYAKRLTELVLKNIIEYGHERKYFVKDKTTHKYRSFTLDMDKVDPEALYDQTLDISLYLPRTKQRIAQAANVLMEKQMQYSQQGQTVDLITPEEWLYFQDLPIKEYMTERMGLQRSQDFLEQVSQTIFQYAELTKQGMDPTEALMATAQTIQDKKSPQPQMSVPPIPE